MTFSADPRAMAWLRRARFWALALLALVVAHDAVYLATFGSEYSDAMAATGHGYWVTYVLLALVLGGIPLLLTGLGLLALRRRIARTRAGLPGPAPRDPAAGPSYLGELAGLLPRLATVLVAGFLLQENLESLAAGHGLPGLHALAGPLTMPVLVLVAALVAAAGALLRWRERVLVARLAAARAAAARHHRPVAASAAPAWGAIAAIVAHGWISARRLAGRAPPSGIAHRMRGPRPASLPVPTV
jgi:hypothetical protein